MYVNQQRAIYRYIVDPSPYFVSSAAAITYVISMVGCTAMLDMFDLFDYGWIDTSTLLLGAVRLWKIKVT